MRTIPPLLDEQLSGPVTTLARCWRLTRADGRVFGFTDHDETIAFDGTVFEAATGLEAGEAERALGLSAGTQEVRGALSALSLTEDDISAGLYDGARVETFVIDWRMIDARMRLEVATIGEVRRGEAGFTAELRGPQAALDRERGRRYRRHCDARFGDARCGMDLALGGRTHTGRIAAQAAGTTVEVEGLEAIDAQDFVAGTLWIENGLDAGPNAGQSREIAAVETGAGRGPGVCTLHLSEPFGFALDAGVAVRLTAGCDRSFTTCRDRFANAANFRGFPHLPGTDAALAIAKSDVLHDGGPVVP